MSSAVTYRSVACPQGKASPGAQNKRACRAKRHVFRPQGGSPGTSGAGIRPGQLNVQRPRHVICPAAGAMDDGSSRATAGPEDMLKLQQDLLQEVAERKRLAAKLIQRLRSEAAEGRVCIMDNQNPSAAAPFSSEKDSKPAVMAFIDTPTKDQTKDQQKVKDTAPTAVPTPSAPPPSVAPKAAAPPTKAPPAPKAATPAPPANKAPAPPPPVNKGPASPPPMSKAPPPPVNKGPPPPVNKGPAPPPASKGPAVTANKSPAPPAKAPPGYAVPPPGLPPSPKRGSPQAASPQVKKTLPPVGSPPSVSGDPAVQTPKVPKIPGTLTFPGSPAPKAKQAVPEKEKVPKVVQQAPETAAPKTAAKVPKEPDAKPLAGENVMKVVMVGAECTPWSKTGGLGDVMGALPKALAARGHRTMVVVPRYDDYSGVNDTETVVRFRVFNSEHEVRYFHLYKDGVDFVFVDHSSFRGHGKEIYGGSRLDIAFRCALLCKAALEAPWHVKCGGVPYGDDNLLFIANDWHTALLPVYLEAHYRQYDQMTYARSMLVIHNMAHQGRGPFKELEDFEIPDEFRPTFFLDDPFGGEHMNIMKAGIMAAHRLVAVSHGYAWECQTQEGGWGLDETLRELSWKFRGIVNGVDLEEWDPATDAFLKEDGYANYTLETMVEGKAKCKAALQKELGLPIDPDVPLLGFIGRLDYQKGVDIIRDSYGWIMDQGCQMIMLGSGTHDLENDLRKMEDDRPNQCKAWVGFNVGVAHRITAGCDILLMPSRFEPCGLNQLYAMHYGTTPVVHAVGGLRDTVQPYDPSKNTGTGWTFDRAESEPLKQALHNAIETYKYHKTSFRSVQTRGMEQDLSWDKAAEEYEEVMVEAKYQW